MEAVAGVFDGFVSAVYGLKATFHELRASVMQLWGEIKGEDGGKAESLQKQIDLLQNELATASPAKQKEFQSAIDRLRAERQQAMNAFSGTEVGRELSAADAARKKMGASTFRDAFKDIRINMAIDAHLDRVLGGDDAGAALGTSFADAFKGAIAEGGLSDMLPEVAAAIAPRESIGDSVNKALREPRFAEFIKAGSADAARLQFFNATSAGGEATETPKKQLSVLEKLERSSRNIESKLNFKVVSFCILMGCLPGLG
jgi:hypothetical protein